MDFWDRQYFKGGVNKERGFPGGLVVKNLPANAGDAGDVDSTLGSGRSPGEGNGNPCQYSCLGNPWTAEPGRLQYIGLQRIRHHGETNTFTFYKLFQEGEKSGSCYSI